MIENKIFFKVLFSCTLTFALCFISIEIRAQDQTYNKVFNPVKGMVRTYEKPYRDEISLNGKWKFMPVMAKDTSMFIRPDVFQWENTPLKIPSPWNVNSFAGQKGGDFVTYPSYPKSWESASIGWMQKEFEIPEYWLGNKLILHFKAIAGYAKIYVNGNFVGENLDIFFSTIVDVSKYLKEGKNVLTVGIAKASLTDDQGRYGRRNYIAGSFWGQHIAGIWQDVSLIKVPQINISDVYIQPKVSKDELTLAIKLKNNGHKDEKIKLQTSIQVWNRPQPLSIDNLAEIDGLEKEVFSIKYPQLINIAVGDSVVVYLHTKVDGRLQYWTPDTPNLYGAVVKLTKASDNTVLDQKYTRFGWREFKIRGQNLYLNGRPIELKGDSWHFMGIPQMTRRYAWGWFKMLKDAKANAVRLHAQPFPDFYLDMADEMGICVLDETAIWSSDGGPRMDSEAYWTSAKSHVKNLVLRDRNHPAVFGWSVCNETLPVAIHVFHAPETIIQRQITEINNWISIVRETDSTRNWISGDGETMKPTHLPTVIGHYGNEESMKEWSTMGKPWGIGETGMAYYGTPKQVATVNGNRAYESQLGRMEGLATEAYKLLNLQKKYNAVYRSIFNIIWYGLKPLPLGLDNTSRSATLEDGIFFTAYKEGQPGVQPERLGPYTTTLNPGYDPNLPLYEPWPLFEAVRAANSNDEFVIGDNPIEKNFNQSSAPAPRSTFIVSGEQSRIYSYLTDLGVNKVSYKRAGIVIVDATNPGDIIKAKKYIQNGVRKNKTFLIMGIHPGAISWLTESVPFPIKITNRKATSFLLGKPDIINMNINNEDLYFSELVKNPVMENGLFIDSPQAVSIIEASNTDWALWNGQAEYQKTAAVYKNELLKKESGIALYKVDTGRGVYYLTTLKLLDLRNNADWLIKKMLSNLGVTFNELSVKDLSVMDNDGVIDRALYLEEGSQILNMDIENINEDIITEKVVTSNNSGYIKIPYEKSKSNSYLSFWVDSPRSLKNLLIEPDMPRLDLIISGQEQYVIKINNEALDMRKGRQNSFKGLPLEKGWNHIQIYPEGKNTKVPIKIEIKSSKKGFLNKIKTSLINQNNN
ncbi:glycoside hydrolase family 2 protein [Galbibacter pacificus]|uniref:Beta-galactosidase n=1 Tax=Galbibacter pacificus TaxID=2996052 RepID=A0ABT6FMQ7_9FLAO|nr:sugar-binding domain-containing protein [Galbibacter pacificus]MDG3581068.1 glycoside hydrolase family 2 TIM barrel-domain containing protein [Galbibacter pacificus]MDG3584546.1 hypothetical protein [Galbibacter pacificus]